MQWRQLIADLIEAGITQEQIAERCAVSQPTVSDLARGATKAPRFDFGTKLVELHRKTCRRKAKAV
jgi:transcriptional regulator with XRE-family HTH domain